MARGLLAKKNPVLVQALVTEGRVEGRVEGKAEGKAEAVLTVLAGRGLRVSHAQAARVRATADAR